MTKKVRKVTKSPKKAKKEPKNPIICDGRITIGFYDDKVTIELDDYDASAKFAVITISPERFVKALSSLAFVPCDIEVRGLDKLGLVMEVNRFQASIKESILDGIPLGERRKYVLKLLRAKFSTDKWEVDDNTDSRDFLRWNHEKKKYVVNGIRRRWVPFKEAGKETKKRIEDRRKFRKEI